MSKEVPRDIDLTIKRDFNNKEPELVSVTLPKEHKDLSYKRYHKYRKNYSTSTESGHTLNSSFSYALHSSVSTTYDLFDDILRSNVLSVEERVCWRKLKNDFNDSELCYWVYSTSNLNFPLGSKYDRIKAKKKLIEIKDGFLGGQYCDRCGIKLNRHNCLTYHECLCIKCYQALSE